jgi:hypothetical protein
MSFGPGSGQFTNLNTAGLGTMQASSASAQPWNRDQVFVGSWDNGFARTVNATATPATWNNVWSGDGVFTRFAQSNTNGGGNWLYAVNYSGNFVWSNDGGASIAMPAGLPNPGLADPVNFPFTARFAVDPNNGASLILGGNTTLYSSKNNGRNWDSTVDYQNLDGRPQAWTSPIAVMAFAPSNSTVLYVACQDGTVWRKDPTTSWTLITAADGLGGTITSLAVDPTNANTVFVSLNLFSERRIQKTTNADAAGGAINVAWQNYVTGLPATPVQTLVTSATGATLYAGTDLGVYSSPTNNANWTRFGTGLPYVQVRDLEFKRFSPTTPYFLVAATYGRGVWMVDPPDGPLAEDEPPAAAAAPTEERPTTGSPVVDLPSPAATSHPLPLPPASAVPTEPAPDMPSVRVTLTDDDLRSLAASLREQTPQRAEQTADTRLPGRADVPPDLDAFFVAWQGDPAAIADPASSAGAYHDADREDVLAPFGLADLSTTALA